MIGDILINGYKTVNGSFKAFQGNGLIVIFFLVAVLFIAFSRRDRFIKDVFVKFPVYVLIVFFLPIWYVYINFKEDYEILYRILWLLPMGVVICYVFVEVIHKLDEKMRPIAFLAAVLLLVVSGEFMYTSEYFSRAENEYHVPDAVVNICDEIEVEGREIRVIVPDELLSYVRQYSSTVCLPYGRETLMGLYTDYVEEIKDYFDAEIIDTPKAVDALRNNDTPYVVVRNDAKFSESLADYGFVYVTSFDDYDMYLDSEAYIGVDYINYR